MNEQYYHPDLVRFAFVFGIVVSVLYYERRQLTTGGIAVPGYLAFTLFQPLIAPAVLAAALVSYLVVEKGLARLALLADPTKFSLTVLVSAGVHFLADFALVALYAVEASSPLLRGIGYIVPGLVAHDFSRHGVAATVANIGAATAVVAAALVAVVVAFPETSRLTASPSPDAFAVDLAFLPLVVFVGLIAWLGIVRLQNLRCGGFLGGAYLTILLPQPVDLLRFLAAALATMLVVRVLLAPAAILFGRRLFAAHMLVGACLSWALFRFVELRATGDYTISVTTPSLAVLDLLLTGLLASDMERAGVGPTLFGAFLSVAFTLTGTLLLLGAIGHQPVEFLAPLFVLLLAGSAVMTIRPERLDALGERLGSRRARDGESRDAR